MRHYDQLMLAIALYESDCREYPKTAGNLNRTNWRTLRSDEKEIWLRRAEVEYKDTRR